VLGLLVRRSSNDFQFTECCTTRAAVTKSLLDRLFFSRFELSELRKIFVEDFHQGVFFVLVCGPSLLIENFSHSSKNGPPCGACSRWKMSAFLLQS
jgi:hypothetical protein